MEDNHKGLKKQVKTFIDKLI